MFIKKPFIYVRQFLNEPRKVFVVCSIFFLINFILNGNFLRIWSSHRDLDRLEFLIKKTQSEILKIDQNINQAKDPQYVERLAREKLDLVDENDLVFIFPGDASEE